MTVMDNQIEVESDENSNVSDIRNESEKETDSDKESDYDENAESSNVNAGWVDSISKILKTTKPKGKKSLVLSKAKKLTDIKDKPKPLGFQVQTEDGTIKDEQLDPLEKVVAKLQEEPPLKKKRKELPDVRVKPNILEKDRERTLSKIATKGVVQLFNAVRTQQKDINKKLKDAGPLEVKRDKVLKSIDKRAFLDVLMGEKSENVEETTKRKEIVKKSEEPTWNVLRDDFMMGAKLKDWDKELESEMENEELEVE